jgi:hypothetical protein
MTDATSHASMREAEESRLRGHLKRQPSGKWAIVQEGEDAKELAAGQEFRLEVAGLPGLQLTRMGRQADRTADGFELRDGLRAAKMA